MEADIPEKVSLPEKGIHDVFVIGMIWKGMGGVFDVVVGSVLLFDNSIIAFISDLVSNELIDDPNDFFVSRAQHLLQFTPADQLFGGIYLIAHGLVKLILVIGLWFNKIWAFPAAIAIISLFIFYQTIRVIQYHSILLSFLTVFDAIFLWLVIHEYRRALKKSVARGV